MALLASENSKVVDAALSACSRLMINNWEELEQPVRRMVAENAFDFIVTREEGALYEMEGYELVCTEYQEYDGVLQPYSLFRAKG